MPLTDEGDYTDPSASPIVVPVEDPKPEVIPPVAEEEV